MIYSYELVKQWCKIVYEQVPKLFIEQMYSSSLKWEIQVDLGRPWGMDFMPINEQG